MENLLSTIHILGNSSDTAHISTACHTTPLRPHPDPAVEIAIQLTPTDEEEIDIVERFVLCTCCCQRAIERMHALLRYHMKLSWHIELSVLNCKETS